MSLKKNLLRGGSLLFAALALVSNTAGSILEANRNVVDGFLGTKSYEVRTTGDAEHYTDFTADYENTDELVAAHRAMGRELAGEGSVLLKNNGALPLSEEAKKVTLLGIRANAQTLYGATIGVSVEASQNVSLTQALEEAGIEANPVINGIYKTLAEESYKKGFNTLSPSFSGVLPGEEPVYNVGEPSEDELKKTSADYKESFSNYSDAALVVIGRPGSEAADFYPGSTGVDTASGARNSLALSDSERALIQMAKDSFETVIVLINSNNTMELRELSEDEGVDAILWIGFPGNYGMRGVSDILTGKVCPSGALADTWASNSASSPAMANFGVYTYENASDYLDTAVDRGDYYLIEAEGIYTGYRYYETRYADLVMGQGKADSAAGTFDSAAGWTYDEEVVYPFGYGLSYTDFSQKLGSLEVSVEDQTVTASVTVTNTGDTAGKTPVELYAQAPYTAGGIEKSAVVLLDFAKTDLLDPGASQTLTITADLQNLASYDEKEAESFILDGGSYYFTLGNGSHEAVNNILAAQGYESGGDSDNVQSWDYAPEGGVDASTFKTTKAGAEVSNKLSNADMNSWLSGTVTYLSRSDWEGTWPKSYEGLSLTEEMLPYLKNDFYEIKTDDDTSSVTYNASQTLSFPQMKGLDYADPQWESLLDQLDLQEAVNFITKGNRQFSSIDSLGFIGGQYVENGPGGFNLALGDYSNAESPWYVSEDDPNAGYKTNDLGSAPLCASTFNRDLMNRYGLLWGNDSLFNSLPFIWAPGLNLHRHPYNGRNCEYYSEDPVLTGGIGTALIAGGLEKGLIMAPKHFAFNDQESNRNGVAPYMSEQKARELELNAFRIAVEGGCLGLMTSFSRLGPVYVSAHEGLIRGILFDEWGFNGYVTTDMVNPGSYMTWKESVIAGSTNFDTKEADESWASYVTAEDNHLSGDLEMLKAVREAVHHTLYVYSNSNLMNAISVDTERIEIDVWWRKAYKAGMFGGTALAVILAVAYLALALKKKEEQ